MTIVFSLNLPRDDSSVPVVRHLFRGSMERLGVEEECIEEMELAITEACTNVLVHAATQKEYEVSVEVDGKSCEVRVTNAGEGFDHSLLSPEAEVTAENGRGIQMMRALVDSVHFMSKPQEGTIVHLVKELRLKDNSALNALAAGVGT